MDLIKQMENKVPRVVTVRRREYGTPVDCIDIPPPLLSHPQKYYCDNEPSCSKYEPGNKNNHLGNVDKKKINRRKKRAKQEKKDQKEKKDPFLQVDVLNELTENFKNVSMRKTNNDEASNSSISRESQEEKSKSYKDKHYTKIITNSKHKVNETRTKKKAIQSRNYKQGSKVYDIQSPRNKKGQSRNDEETHFEEYLTKEQVDEGLKNGELFKGYIRVNPKDYKAAYIANPIKGENDVMLEGLSDRNRALDSDLVVVRLKQEDKWRSPKHKTCTVVYILQCIHPRQVIGTLRLAPDRNKQYAVLYPRDPRVPRLKILFTDWPPLFYDNADKYENILYLAKIKEWPNSKFANGTLLENIGMSGDIKVETAAILKENCIDVTPYGDEMKKYYVSSCEIPEKELIERQDLRKECIFTIDPLTARDLDDAVSCKVLSDGNLEVGVHISDVTYYLPEGTPLNEIVAERATSTYMVESVYHMLPKELCMICSLLPGQDKLAFSVFWVMTPDGNVISHRISRTVINSCTQLAYEHVQQMLEQPERQFTTDELPVIYNGYGPQDLSTTANRLNKIAVKLRQGRFDSGALRIDQPKLCFQIDPATCLPTSYCIYENKDAHRLIEEFMLLANITVAEYLKEQYPDIAFLRSHPAPGEVLIERLQVLLEKVGILLDVSSAGALQRSLWSYAGNNGDVDNDRTAEARMLVLCNLSAKTMTRAHYFCANSCDKVDEYWHYALNIPIYTHYTSPIRRYADIMVHRLLAGALGYSERPAWIVDYVASVAANCNKQKLNAKRAGEQSLELYYLHYLKQYGPLIEAAVVYEVRESSFDVIIMNSGVSCRVFLHVLPKKVKYQILDEDGKEIVRNKNGNESNEQEKREFTSDKKIKTLAIKWPEKDPKAAPKLQVIALFTTVMVKLSKHEKKLKLEAELLKPN